MIRSILFNFIFYFSIVFFGILFLPFLISEKFTRYAVRFWATLIIFLLEKLVGAKILYQNKYIIDNKGYLVAANHQSVFDTIFFLSTRNDKILHFIVKQ